MEIKYETPANFLQVALKERTKMSVKNSKASSLNDVMSMAKPIIYPVTIDRASDDEDIKIFLQSQKEKSSFYLLILHFSFGVMKNVSTEAVKIELAITDDPEKEVVFMSLDPSRIESSQEVERTNSGKVELGIIDGLLKIGFEGSKNKKNNRTEAFIIAEGEHLNIAHWIFTRTTQDNIQGSFCLKSIIKTPKGLKVTGEIDIEARVQKKLMNIIPYKSYFEKDSFGTFKIG